MTTDADLPNVIAGTTTTIAPEVIARFLQKIAVNQATGCHEWTAHIASNGYGRIQVAGKACGAHRIAWEIYRGPILDGLHVLHRCDNRKCVNPAHLFLGTQADNMADRDNKDRHFKPHGHLNPMYKITPEMNEKIKAEYLNGTDSIDLIAERFGVCAKMVIRSADGEKRGRAGFRNGRAKMTAESAKKVRDMAKAGVNLTTIAREIGVSYPTVKRVIDGVSFV